MPGKPKVCDVMSASCSAPKVGIGVELMSCGHQDPIQTEPAGENGVNAATVLLDNLTGCVASIARRCSQTDILT